MSRHFVAASLQYLWNAAAAVTGPPCTLACWARPATIAAGPTLTALGVGSTTNQDHLGLIDTNGDARAYTRGGAVGGTFSGVAGVVVNTWHHFAGVYPSTTSRTGYKNGTAGVPETTAQTPTTLDRTTVGVLQQGSGLNSYFDGDVAWAAIWSVALTALEVATLATGVDPRTVRPASLLACWPLAGTASPEPDVVGTFALTVVGATAGATDPPMLLAAARAHQMFAIF